jgi:hypothetical protein
MYSNNIHDLNNDLQLYAMNDWFCSIYYNIFYCVIWVIFAYFDLFLVIYMD